MLETLIAILLSLGLNFSQTENGCIQIDQGAELKQVRFVLFDAFTYQAYREALAKP